MTKAHNLYRYLKDKHNLDEKDEDTKLFLTLFNMSDSEFWIAVQDPVYESDCGLHAEWD